DRGPPPRRSVPDDRARAALRRLHAPPLPGGRALVPPTEPDAPLGGGADLRALPRRPGYAPRPPDGTGTGAPDRGARSAARPRRRAGAAPPRGVPPRARGGARAPG